MKPILLINLKTYSEGTGEKALEIAGIAKRLSAGSRADIILSASPCDIRLIREKTGVKVFAQHVDFVKYGSHTGWILPEAVKDAGAEGTILNHSERRVDFNTLGKTIERCREAGLKTVVCCESPSEGKRIAGLGPDYIAIEPPELIGGDVSVSTARPGAIKESVGIISDVPVLTGAGVKNSEDVKKALELGSKGILVASGVVKSENPEEAIKDLLRGFE